MNKDDILLMDTNAVIYLINGDDTVLQLIDKRSVAINFIIEIELLGWPGMTPNLQKIIRQLILDVQYFDYSSRVKDITISLQQKYKLKLGDAFIAATALEYNLLLVSADKNFSKVEDLIFINFIPTL